MIQQETRLKVADNSGAKKIMCIGLRGGSAGQYGHVGDIITASVKEAANELRIGMVLNAMTMRRAGRMYR